MVTAIVTILIFLLLISLHEFGHFIVSKLSGVPVHEFSIGMGPAIYKKQGKETLYSIRLFPVGGYCKLEGEDEDSDNPYAFTNQKLWKKFLVVSAGAILNIVLGYVLIVIMTLAQPHPQGQPNMINVPVVDSIIENSNIKGGQIQSGDRIIKINGHRIYFYNDIPLYTDEFKENQEVEITVLRENEKIDVNIIPTVREVEYTYNDDALKIKTSTNGIEVTQTVPYDEENINLVKDYIGQTATEKNLIIGFTPKTEEVGISNIFGYSFHYTGYIVRMVYNSLWDMITGQTGFDEVSGPVGIVSAVNTAVNTGKYSLVNVIMLAALLSINLGIFNLLPLPALDGGRLFFMLIELMRGKPIPPEKEGLVHGIGLVLLLVFAVFVSFNDIVKIINL